METVDFGLLDTDLTSLGTGEKERTSLGHRKAESVGQLFDP